MADLTNMPFAHREWAAGDPVGIDEIAMMTGRERKSVRRWATNAIQAQAGRRVDGAPQLVLPAADYWANGGPLWERRTIKEWAEEIGLPIVDPLAGSGGPRSF